MKTMKQERERREREQPEALREKDGEFLEITGAISEVIRSSGKHSDVIMAALVDVLAMCLAAFPPDQRFERHVWSLNMLDELVEHHIKQAIAAGQAPPDWEKGTRT